MWKKAFIGSIIVGIGLLFTNSSLSILVLEFVKTQFEQFGLSTRVIDLAIGGKVISYTAGRDEIYGLAIQKIIERPIFGYGVYGEWPWLGWNIHNIYIELLIHYGLVLGVVLLIWMIHLVFKAYFITSNTYARDMILIWSCLVFVRGIFGGSYLQFPVFFLIGLCLQEIQRIKKKYYLNLSDKALYRLR